jgi:hypothetical protein
LKKNVRQFKNLKIALQELKPFILDGRQILRGNQISRFDDVSGGGNTVGFGRLENRDLSRGAA